MKEYTVILVYRNNYADVLLQMKNRGPKCNVGKWNGVGGKLELNECPDACAVRETVEEAGVVQDGFVLFEKLTVQEFPKSSITVDEVRLHVYYGLLRDGVEIIQSEDERLSWFESDSLYGLYDLMAGFGNLIHWNDLVVSHYRGE